MTDDNDLGGLRQRYPAWRIETIWVTGNSGPDARIITATKGDVTLAAWTIAMLADQLRLAEREH